MEDGRKLLRVEEDEDEGEECEGEEVEHFTFFSFIIIFFNSEQLLSILHSFFSLLHLPSFFFFLFLFLFLVCIPSLYFNRNYQKQYKR